MPVETQTPPAPPTGPEIKLGGSRSASRTTLPDGLLNAIDKEANKNAPPGAPAAEPLRQPDPPPATPPEPKAKQPEPPKPATPPAKEPPKSDKEENLANLRKKLEQREADFAALQNSATATSKEKADADLKRAEAEAKLQAALEREDKEYKPRVERLKVVEQELQKREEVLRVKAYQETPEFHEKFVKPLVDAQGEITELLAELIVDNGDGTNRPATMDDFNEVLSARSLNESHAIAAKKFGPIAPTVVNFKTRIRSLERNRAEAIKRSGEMALEYEQRRQGEIIQQQQQFRTAVYSEAERLLKESLQVDDDPDEKAALTEAQQFADDLWNNNNESVEQVVKKAAKARKNNIEAPVLRKKLDKASKRIAELEEQLKQYQRSEPELRPRGGGTQPGGAGTNGERPERASLMAKINELASQPR